MGVILTKPTNIDVYSFNEKLAMELETSFKAAKLHNYKELTYTDGDLTSVDIYENNTKAVKLFNKTLTYTLGYLTQTVLTRISDSATLTKDFVYDVDNNLESVTVS
jgi:hypothetical protein